MDGTLSIRDPHGMYTHEQVLCLLERANDLGFWLGAGSPLEGISVMELETLVDEGTDLFAVLHKRREN
jgi:hypothetical protein